MLYIKKMRIQIQRDNGKVITPLNKEKKDSFTIAGMLNQKKVDINKSASLSKQSDGSLVTQMKKDQKAIDGYWIVLQNWSQCTLKCGGGKTYLHRMCVPPKNGGKPCIGEAIVTRECNVKPCPKVKESKELFRNRTTTLKPIIKIMPFSTRPQRYSKCIIKESDFLYSKNLANGVKDQLTTHMGEDKPDSMDSVKIPVRIVMNNRTITLFAGEDYDTHVETFILKKSKFLRDANNADCFLLQEEIGNKQAQLCAFTEGKKAVEEWDYDFNLFKLQCSSKRPEHIMNEFQKKLQEKMQDVKKGLLDEAQETMKRKAQETEEMKLETKIKSTSKVALQAIQKEVNLEELIKKEELEREKKEEEFMMKKIDEEKKKSVN